MAKIIVTGAAGFIGSHTVECLLAGGHSVLGLDNLRAGNPDNLTPSRSNERFQFVKEDIRNTAALDRVFGGFKPDAVLHLAALVSVQESVENPELNFEINLRGTHNVAEAVRRHKVPRIVLASSAAVYGDNENLPLAEDALPAPASPYGMAKLASEELLLTCGRCYGLEAFCLRYFNVYGPRQDPSSPYSGVISVFLHKLKAGLPPAIYGDGKQTRDFISVHDAARANCLAVSGKQVRNGVYNVCTGHQTSLLDIIRILKKHAPDWLPPEFAPPRSGDILHSRGNPEKIRRVLGFTAEKPLAEGLAEMAG